jgi:hypothetical protein
MTQLLSRKQRPIAVLASTLTNWRLNAGDTASIIVQFSIQLTISSLHFVFVHLCVETARISYNHHNNKWNFVIAAKNEFSNWIKKTE